MLTIRRISPPNAPITAQRRREAPQTPAPTQPGRLRILAAGAGATDPSAASDGCGAQVTGLALDAVVSIVLAVMAVTVAAAAVVAIVATAAAVVVGPLTLAVAARHDAAEIAGPEGTLAGEVDVLFGLSGAAVVAGAPAIAAGENVLDALVGGGLGRQPAPRGDECAAIEVLDLADISRLGQTRYRGSGVIVCWLVGDDPRDATKCRSGAERGCDIVPIPIHLDHEDADLESAVDFALLQEVPPDDAIHHAGGGLDVNALTGPAHGVGRADADTAAPAPRDGGRGGWQRLLAEEGLALLDVLVEVEADDTEGGLVVAREGLEDLELNGTVGEVISLAVDGDADVRNGLCVVVVYAVVDNVTTVRVAAALLRVHLVAEMPLDEGLPRGEWDIIEIKDLYMDIELGPTASN